MAEQKPLTTEDLDFFEKVKAPEYAGYGWVNAAEDLRRVIQYARMLVANIAILEKRLVDAEGGVPVPSERSDGAEKRPK